MACSRFFGVGVEHLSQWAVISDNIPDMPKKKKNRNHWKTYRACSWFFLAVGLNIYTNKLWIHNIIFQVCWNKTNIEINGKPTGIVHEFFGGGRWKFHPIMSCDFTREYSRYVVKKIINQPCRLRTSFYFFFFGQTWYLKYYLWTVQKGRDYAHFGLFL